MHPVVGYSVSLTEWEGVEKSVDKEVLRRISDLEELCRTNNVRITMTFFHLQKNEGITMEVYNKVIIYSKIINLVIPIVFFW